MKKIGVGIGILSSCFLLLTTPVKADEELLESPIEQVYAGGEFVLFLHEDTSITGFGSNTLDVLGVEGGEENNTASLQRVHEPTGFDHLKTKRGRAYGFRPVDNSEGLYDTYQLRSGLNLMEENVRDYDHSARGGYSSNPHDGYGYITEEGLVWNAGSDYWTNLGIGEYYTDTRSGASGYVLADDSVDGDLIMEGFSTEENAGDEKVKYSDEFSAQSNNDKVTLEVRYENREEDYVDTSMQIEVLNSEGDVVSSFTDPYRIHRSNFTSTRHLEVDDLDDSKNYRLRITSSNTGWDIKVKDRRYLEDAISLHWNTGQRASFVVVNEQEEMFIHRQGWGNVQPIDMPEDVTFQFDSLEVGMDRDYYLIDDSDELWTWDSTTMSLVDFPDVDGQSFYDVYGVKEVANGDGFNIAVAEKRDGAEETNVFVWGENKHGRLGLEGVEEGEEINNPTLLKRGDEPLDNIVGVAAGVDFSVIVQNTDEGQLVWTSGHNAKGQLGGGITLNIKEPQLIPGLSNIESLAVGNTPEVVAASDDEVISFGGPKSYPEVTNLSRINSTLSDKTFDKWVQSQTSYWRQSIFSRPTGTTFIVSKGNRKPYGFGHSSYGGTSVTSQSFTPITIHSDYDGAFGRELGDREFESILSIDDTGFGGVLVDKSGRLWGWGTGSRSGVRSQANIRPNQDGEYTRTEYAHPHIDSDENYLPDIFTQVAGTHGGGYALTENGHLWYFTSSIAPINSSWEVNEVKLVEIDGGDNNYFTAIDESGELWYWRRGGEPNKIDRSNYDDLDVIDISTGENHRLFITEDNRVWSFGNNGNGKLGDGTMEDSSSPVQVLNVEGAEKVYAGQDVSFAIDDQGSVWSWGYAAYGSLGNNFSLERSLPSTAVGNDLPRMTIENDIGTTYLSETGNTNFRLFGDIEEPDMEATTIKASVLGKEKEDVIDSDSWEIDVYDEVIPQSWELSWDLTEVDEDSRSQFLTTVSAIDERGGIIEQVFSGDIIVDNDSPEIPSWGEVCLVENHGEDNESEVCHDSDYFERGGSNGVDQPIRLYIDVEQKSGSNRAPVFPEVQYRERHHYGYTNDWTEWEPVMDENDNGFYVDVFQGFLGEHQFRVKAVDEAGNESARQEESVYTILSNAGAEIESVDITPNSDEIQDIYNVLDIEADTPDGAGIRSYDIQRFRDGDTNDERQENWVQLENGRIDHEDDTFQYTDEDSDLLGNGLYHYRVNAENSVAVGDNYVESIYTNPLIPSNFTRNPDEEGITFVASQDNDNRGELLYRLVLIDNLTGETYSVDEVSDNRFQDIIFELEDTEVPFAIVNNSIQIHLLIRGENGNFVTEIYDDDYMNSPEVSNDTQAPDAMINVVGSSEIDRETQDTMTVGVFANDNVSPPENLDVQFSFDGESWKGTDSSGRWIDNYWSRYQNEYQNMPLPERLGRHIVYVRVRDDAGNIGYDNTEINLTSPLERDGTTGIEDADVIEREDFSTTESIHVSDSRVSIDVPRTGDIDEVQYSFDGVHWSEWERVNDNHNKRISLPSGEGSRNIFTRFRNEYGSVSDVTDMDVIDYIVDRGAPTLDVETDNGTYITSESSVELQVTPRDNYSEEVLFTLDNDEYAMTIEEDGEVYEVESGTILLTTDDSHRITIHQLSDGFNMFNFRMEDKAGNVGNDTMRIFRK